MASSQSGRRYAAERFERKGTFPSFGALAHEKARTEGRGRGMLLGFLTSVCCAGGGQGLVGAGRSGRCGYKVA